jgi:succinylglutamate desuccinylase
MTLDLFLFTFKFIFFYKNAQGVKRISDDFDNELQIDVKLFTALYADDTVLMSESTEELQNQEIHVLIV